MVAEKRRRAADCVGWLSARTKAAHRPFPRPHGRIPLTPHIDVQRADFAVVCAGDRRDLPVSPKIERIPGFLNFTDQQVSQPLAMRGLIEPFVSVGYLSNVANDVYTVSALTSGGSNGSPVLDSQGKVIAIHSATLTGVAGGGLAVPSRIAR
jgi:S1-C subfamily serine protease